MQQWKPHQREHGTQALLSDERGRKHGEKRLMSAAQENDVQKRITDNLPEQSKLPFALRTRKAVAQLLDKRFALKLPVHTMRLYLSRCVFTPPQKPLKRACEQRPKEVKEWLEQKYP